MRNNWFIMLLFGLLFSAGSFAAIKEDAIAPLAKQQGFFFFYSASCPHCQHFAPRLKRFSERYGFKVLAISVDGGFLPSFPDAVMNDGQAKVFDVTILPALFLVNPDTQKAALVNEGTIDEAELTRRLLKISRMQAEGSSS